jgi:hypothetical protein
MQTEFQITKFTDEVSLNDPEPAPKTTLGKESGLIYYIMAVKSHSMWAV